MKSCPDITCIKLILMAKQLKTMLQAVVDYQIH